MRTACLALVLGLVAGTAAAQGIQRCEDPQGRPTYTNGACPTGTQARRAVDTSPPVSEADRAAAQHRGQSEVERAKTLARQEEQERDKLRVHDERERKTQAAAAERCDQARRELKRAQEARDDLSGKNGRVEQRQRADRLVRRQQDEAERLCPKP